MIRSMASNGALRQRLRVERKKNGLCCRRVVVHEVRMTEVLFALGYLTSHDPPQKKRTKR